MVKIQLKYMIVEWVILLFKYLKFNVNIKTLENCQTL